VKKKKGHEREILPIRLEGKCEITEDLSWDLHLGNRRNVAMPPELLKEGKAYLCEGEKPILFVLALVGPLVEKGDSHARRTFFRGKGKSGEKRRP